ncbi:MAG TPA: hypothetical protein VJR68_03585 [Dyella sp.]|nr:hypothetical protein [Dyella sp.]
MWRLSGMLAAVLTLVFVLFVKNNSGQPASIGASSQASYSSQVSAGKTVGTPSGAYSSTAGISSPPTVVASRTTRLQAASSTVSPRVHTANLSLATPGSSSAGAGDLDGALGGRSYNGLVNVDGYKVPLPAGNWVVLSNGRYKSPHATGELVFLGLVKNRRLVGGARISALHSAGQPGSDFPPKLKGCAGANNVDLYVNAEAMNADGHQSCWLVDSFFTPPMQQWADRAVKIGSLDRAAAGDLAAKGVTYPQDFLRIRMTRTETWGLLEVSYLFSPEAAGIKSNEAISAADTDWDCKNISRYPEKVAYVEKMKEWATQFWPRLKVAFDQGSH